MRVLVVDDNQEGARMIGHWLSVRGHEVRVVFNGSLAVKEAQLFHPRLILLDIVMSGMSGLEVCRVIRTFSLGPVMIVAITGQDGEDDKQRAREAGFDRHLSKPLDKMLLSEVLRSVEATTAGGEG